MASIDGGREDGTTLSYFPTTQTNILMLEQQMLLLCTDASSKANLPSLHEQEEEREGALSYFPITQTNILKLEQRMLAAVHCGQQLGIHSLSSYAVRRKGGCLKRIPYKTNKYSDS